MDATADVATQQSSDSRRFYCSTKTEVRLGDRIRIRRRFRHFVDGTFCYVPGEGRPDTRMGNGPNEDWVIKTDDGKLLSESHLPGPLFPTGDYPSRFAELSKRITFIRRREPADPEPENLLPPPPHSLMYYRGTNIDVRLGDHVRFKSIFTGWRITEATISYIPGISPIDSGFEAGGRDWAYTTNDGNIYAGSAYFPGQIVKTLTFIRRAEGK